MIDIGGGRYVLYAHLKQGSARVRVGDRVVSGQDIGLVGDSGNSDEPHLHIQVQNSPSFDIWTTTSRRSRSSSATRS